MLRKLLVYLFIVTSLSAQARIAFACEMMGGALMEDCCCDQMDAPQLPKEPSASAVEPCCMQVAQIGADQAGTSDTAKSAFKALTPDLQPQPVAVATSTAVLPVSRKFAALRDVPPESISRPGTLTYLNTLRLRI